MSQDNGKTEAPTTVTLTLSGIPRENHIRAIADARSPLAKKVERLAEPVTGTGPRLAD